MSDNPAHASDRGVAPSRSARMTVPEIAARLNIGRMAVYGMLEQGVIPGIRIGRKWLVTRRAYETFERNCGMRPGTGFLTQPEVKVLP